MEKPPSKAEIRATVEAQTRRFLRQGGKVQRIPQGMSSHSEDAAPQARHSRPLFLRQARPRTPLDDVIAELDRRKQEQRLKRRNRSRTRGRAVKTPRRRIIYDDFGEPVRKVWL